MEHLYAPWRYSYVSEEKIEGCVFCHISKNLDDEKLQVLFHDDLCYVVMNKFPYSPGHMMVIPHFHTDKIEDLDNLCSELRSDMINIVSKTGGHLGAGLGVVELAVAIHYVFNTPDDRLIWDVGHQAYPHKILTNRRDKMNTAD